MGNFELGKDEGKPDHRALPSDDAPASGKVQPQDKGVSQTPQKERSLVPKKDITGDELEAASEFEADEEEMSWTSVADVSTGSINDQTRHQSSESLKPITINENKKVLSAQPVGFKECLGIPPYVSCPPTGTTPSQQLQVTSRPEDKGRLLGKRHAPHQLSRENNKVQITFKGKAPSRPVAGRTPASADLKKP